MYTAFSCHDARTAANAGSCMKFFLRSFSNLVMVRFFRESSSFALTVDHQSVAASPPRVSDTATFYTLQVFSRDNISLMKQLFWDKSSRHPVGTSSWPLTQRFRSPKKLSCALVLETIDSGWTKFIEDETWAKYDRSADRAINRCSPDFSSNWS